MTWAGLSGCAPLGKVAVRHGARGAAGLCAGAKCAAESHQGTGKPFAVHFTPMARRNVSILDWLD